MKRTKKKSVASFSLPYGKPVHLSKWLLSMQSLLRSRYSEMTSDLGEFEAHLLQGAREMPELKLWQVQGTYLREEVGCAWVSSCHSSCLSLFGQDLGFQAAQRVSAAGSDFGLKVLKDIAQNLPTQAK